MAINLATFAGVTCTASPTANAYNLLNDTCRAGTPAISLVGAVIETLKNKTPDERRAVFTSELTTEAVAAVASLLPAATLGHMFPQMPSSRALRRVLLERAAHGSGHRRVTSDILRTLSDTECVEIAQAGIAAPLLHTLTNGNIVETLPDSEHGTALIALAIATDTFTDDVAQAALLHGWYNNNHPYTLEHYLAVIADPTIPVAYALQLATLAGCGVQVCETLRSRGDLGTIDYPWDEIVDAKKGENHLLADILFEATAHRIGEDHHLHHNLPLTLATVDLPPKPEGPITVWNNPAQWLSGHTHRTDEDIAGIIGVYHCTATTPDFTTLKTLVEEVPAAAVLCLLHVAGDLDTAEDAIALLAETITADDIASVVKDRNRVRNFNSYHPRFTLSTLQPLPGKVVMWLALRGIVPAMDVLTGRFGGKLTTAHYLQLLKSHYHCYGRYSPLPYEVVADIATNTGNSRTIIKYLLRHLASVGCAYAAAAGELPEPLTAEIRTMLHASGCRDSEKWEALSRQAQYAAESHTSRGLTLREAIETVL